MATTLRIKTTSGVPCDLTFRNGTGEKLNHGGAILTITGNVIKLFQVEIWLSGDDRRALKGLL